MVDRVMEALQVKYLVSTLQSMMPKGDTKDFTQDDTQRDTQDGIQVNEFDKWIEHQIRQNPQITTEELTKMSKIDLRTVKRHIANMPHIRYVSSGYSVHWGIHDK